MKICFISTVFGDPTTIDRPALFKKMDGCDYFLFTDHDASYFGETSWDIVNIKSNKNISEIDSNIIKSRYPKFMSWELLESMGKTYDYVFYCDTWTWPNINMDWNDICKKVSQNKDFPLVQSMHPNPKVRKNGIRGEVGLILKLKRETKDSLDKTLSFMQSTAPEVNLSKSNYFYENTSFGYEFKSSIIRNFTKEFWKTYTTEDISFRDQPLWNFMLMKNKVRPFNFPLLKWQFKPKPPIRKTWMFGNCYFCHDYNLLNDSVRKNYNKGNE